MWKLIKKLTNRSKQSQESGNNSTNLQGQTLVVNQGITYSDAKEIAIDVFKANFLELSHKASQTAFARAEELVDNFIEKLKVRDPKSVENMGCPGVQYAIFNAQKEYARTGDKELSDVLVDILVDRAGQKERTLKQIVLDESINVVPKLTIQQLDTLSLVFLLKFSQNTSVVDDNSLRRYFQEYICPLISNLSKEPSLYQHLEFTGCGSISIGEMKIENVFATTYKGLFLKGFTREEFEKTFDDYMIYEDLIIPCLNDPERLQVRARNDENLDDLMKKLNITDQDKIKQLKVLFGQNPMNDKEVLDKLARLENSLTGFIEIWNSCLMKNMTLTSVGIAVANANVRRKTGIEIDLGIWIK